MLEWGNVGEVFLLPTCCWGSGLLILALSSFRRWRVRSQAAHDDSYVGVITVTAVRFDSTFRSTQQSALMEDMIIVMSLMKTDMELCLCSTRGALLNSYSCAR